MRKFPALVFMIGVLLVPVSVAAQEPMRFATASIQLWPEYDQPSMLVIEEFTFTKGITLPASVEIRYPKAANLAAVASQAADGNLLNAQYRDSTAEGDWKAITLTVDQAIPYRIEYYQPLTKNGNQRTFTYLWKSTYAADNLSISVKRAVDSTDIKTTPTLTAVNADKDLTGDLGRQAAGQQVVFQLSYTKPNATLAVTASSVQASQNLDSNTQGRVDLNKYLPWVLGGLLALIVIGAIAYLVNSPRTEQESRRRHRPTPRAEGSGEGYCAQCGTRTRTGDRFCRICGARIRPPEA